MVQLAVCIREDKVMRIFVTSSYGWWGDFSPNDIVEGSRQVGGGETAMVNISKELAGLGHEVFVFYASKPGLYGGVNYVSPDLLVPMITQIEHDVLVAWDASWAFRFRDKAKVRVLAFQLNDAQIGVYDWVIDKYFHPSQWHADRFKELYPEMSVDKQMSQLTNGMDFSRYEQTFEPRQWNRVTYSSSPDRGLHHLLRLWPKVIKEVPDAELHVFYDVDKWLEMDAAVGDRSPTHDRANAVRAAISKPPKNVVFRGGIGQGELSAEHVKSAILAYPCDPVAPTEGFSMTVLEGIVAGCEVIISNADAFPELWQDAPGVTMLPLPIDDNLWASVLVEKMKNGNEERELRIRPNMSWKSIARRWATELKLCLTPTTS